MIRATAIIPTYCRPLETACCVQRLAESTRLGDEFNLEVVIVDSSPDEFTAESLAPLRDALPVRYLKRQEQTPPGEARNLAVAEAQSELIVSVDSDMEVEPETVGSMIGYLRDHPRVARMTGTSIFSAGEQAGQLDYPVAHHLLLRDGDTVFAQGVHGRFETFYRSAFLEVGGYDPLFDFRGEGEELSWRFWRAGLPLGYCEEAKAFHNVAAPMGLVRTRPDRLAQRYRSLLLVAHKYDVSERCAGFAEACDRWYEGQEHLVAHSMLCVSETLQWLAVNYGRIMQAKEQAPHAFDLKPYGIFEDQDVFAACLAQAEARIRPFHRAVFGAD